MQPRVLNDNEPQETTGHPMLIPILMLSMLVLSAVDWVITTLAVQVDGSLAEFNPLMRWVIESWGMEGVAVVKAITFALLFVVVWIARRTHTYLVENGLLFCTTLYFINVLWGLWVSYE